MLDRSQLVASDLPCLSAGFLGHHGYMQNNRIGPAFEIHGAKIVIANYQGRLFLMTFVDDQVVFSKILDLSHTQ